MNKTISKINGIISVTCSFDLKLGIQRNVRFYCDNALEYAKQEFPDSDITIIDDDTRTLTISNYREPFSGTWTFYVNKNEEKELKHEEESDKLVKKRSSKKSKEIETINDT